MRLVIPERTNSLKSLQSLGLCGRSDEGGNGAVEAEQEREIQLHFARAHFEGLGDFMSQSENRVIIAKIY